MDNDKIKEITEALGLEAKDEGEFVMILTSIGYFDGDRCEAWEVFAPDKSWNDCGMVLEALIKKHGKEACSKIEISDFFNDEFNVRLGFLGGKKDFPSFSIKESICKAYLSTLEVNK